MLLPYLYINGLAGRVSLSPRGKPLLFPFQMLFGLHGWREAEEPVSCSLDHLVTKKL